MANRTVNTIIDKAYRLIGVKSSERPLTGDQVTDGLDALNVLLDELSGIGTYIPSFTDYNFQLVIGERDKIFTKELNGFTITELSHVSIIEDNILYPVKIISDTLYFEGNSLTDSGRPTQCFLNNKPMTDPRITGSIITFYTTPDKAYNCLMKGKMSITNQALNTDVTSIPPYMIFYLNYALARILHGYDPSSHWDVTKEDCYIQSRGDMIVSNARNLDMKTTSIFQAGGYACTNLSSLS